MLQSGAGADADEEIDPRKLRHDLRTPINAVKGYGEMLIEDAASAGHETFVADLAQLLTAADGMLARIDALVDFSGQPAGLLPRPGRSIMPRSAELCG